MTILLYITVFLLALCQGWNTEDKRHYGIWKHRMVTGLSILWKLCFLFAVRSALWMYILMGERFPDRITHSLYFMEQGFCLSLSCKSAGLAEHIWYG